VEAEHPAFVSWRFASAGYGEYDVKQMAMLSITKSNTRKHEHEELQHVANLLLTAPLIFSANKFGAAQVGLFHNCCVANGRLPVAVQRDRGWSPQSSSMCRFVCLIDFVAANMGELVGTLRPRF